MGCWPSFLISTHACEARKKTIYFSEADFLIELRAIRTLPVVSRSEIGRRRRVIDELLDQPDAIHR